MISSVPWLAFGVVILAMLALDLRMRRRIPEASQTRAAVAWTMAWFALAAVFGTSVTAVRGPEAGIEFFTAYCVEQALSIDNLFVMMVVFARFRVPRAAQHRVLTYGIAGVVVFRGVMIASGTTLVERFHVLVYVLGGVLLIAAWKLLRELRAGDRAPEAAPPGARGVRAVVARFLPITDDFVGSRFTVVRAGVRCATPLLLALITIEIADAVFALDSIPAVLGITTDRFLVFTSNLFAVLGLRSMYFALSGALDRLRYLKHGLVGVLALVGTKMIVGAVWVAPAWLSLVLVTLVLGGAVAASLATSTTKEINAEPS